MASSLNVTATDVGVAQAVDVLVVFVEVELLPPVLAGQIVLVAVLQEPVAEPLEQVEGRLNYTCEYGRSLHLRFVDLQLRRPRTLEQ